MTSSDINFFSSALTTFSLATTCQRECTAGASILKRRPAIHNMLPTCLLVSSSRSEPPQPLSLPSTLVLPLPHTFSGPPPLRSAPLRSHPLICTWEPRWWHPRASDEAWRCVPTCSYSLSHPSHTECRHTSAHDQMSQKDIKTRLFRAHQHSSEFKGDSAKISIYSFALPFLHCLFACFSTKMPSTGAKVYS